MRLLFRIAQNPPVDATVLSCFAALGRLASDR